MFSPSPPPSDPRLQTVPLDDTDVLADAPRVGLEEMLQQMSISDGGRGDGGRGDGRRGDGWRDDGGRGDGWRGDNGRGDGGMGGEEMVTE